MNPGDLIQLMLDQWRLDIIYRLDGMWYMAAQRDTPERRMFDARGDDFDELAAVVANHTVEIDTRDGLL